VNFVYILNTVAEISPALWTQTLPDSEYQKVTIAESRKINIYENLKALSGQ
jgi:hypothetical protein